MFAPLLQHTRLLKQQCSAGIPTCIQGCRPYSAGRRHCSRKPDSVLSRFATCSCAAWPTSECAINPSMIAQFTVGQIEGIDDQMGRRERIDCICTRRVLRSEYLHIADDRIVRVVRRHLPLCVLLPAVGQAVLGQHQLWAVLIGQGVGLQEVLEGVDRLLPLMQPLIGLAQVEIGQRIIGI